MARTTVGRTEKVLDVVDNPRDLDDPVTFPRIKLQQLPRPLPPFPNETLKSYLRRLRSANGVATEISLRIGSGDQRAIALSELTGRSLVGLTFALPELRSRGYVGRALKIQSCCEPVRYRLACRHCTLARGAAGEVHTWVTHEQTVCLRHHQWLGDASDGDWHHLDITQCPDIAQANRRHRNLIARHGRQAVRDAYTTARGICWSWFRDESYRFTSVNQRIRVLAPGRSARWFEPQPRAALYPNVVALTSLITSPLWRALAESNDPGDTLRVVDRIAADVTDFTPEWAYRHFLPDGTKVSRHQLLMAIQDHQRPDQQPGLSI